MTMQTSPDKNCLEDLSRSEYHRDLYAPFTISLKPLGDKNFLQIDGDFLPFRKLKQDYYSRIHDEVCQAEPDTVEAQQEVERLVVESLKSGFPHLYEFTDTHAICRQTGEQFEFNRDMPISSAALIIPDDLILMRRDESGWRLVAGSMAFPASWNLQEKFSRSLEAVHGPVPMSDRMSQRINRIFDALQPTIPVWRTNWSLDEVADLRQPSLESDPRKKGEKLSSNVYFRTEFQTLHKLPVSQDILFTIRTKSTPVTRLANDELGRSKLTKMHRQYQEMSDAERDYKGINHNADGLLAWLEQYGTK